MPLQQEEPVVHFRGGRMSTQLLAEKDILVTYALAIARRLPSSCTNTNPADAARARWALQD